MPGENYIVVAYSVFMSVGALLSLVFFAYVLVTTLKDANDAEEAEAAKQAEAVTDHQDGDIPAGEIGVYRAAPPPTDPPAGAPPA